MKIPQPDPIAFETVQVNKLKVAAKLGRARESVWKPLAVALVQHWQEYQEAMTQWDRGGRKTDRPLQTGIRIGFDGRAPTDARDRAQQALNRQLARISSGELKADARLELGDDEQPIAVVAVAVQNFEPVRRRRKKASNEPEETV